MSDPAWVRAGQPLCLIGDSGTGKSHLLIGIGTAMAEAGLKVRYTTTVNLVNEPAEDADEKKLSRTVARYGRVDLLCPDELGYLDLDKAGEKLLFQIFTEERRAIAIASNAPFFEWKQTFHRPPALHRDRRPRHVQRTHRRDRHRVLPVHPDPAQAAPQLAPASTLGKAMSQSLCLRPQVIARWENRVRVDRIWGL
ncbi:MULTISPECIES: ATP-binding protein [unclassified Streptomyces]|uniref:ATP-binding protein n=1 Tax=unclassified Streptomyces TaxID=2593676 RepID=UPI003869CBAB